jgi:hypothetical protein
MSYIVDDRLGEGELYEMLRVLVIARSLTLRSKREEKSCVDHVPIISRDRCWVPSRESAWRCDPSFNCSSFGNDSDKTGDGRSITFSHMRPDHDRLQL